MRHYRKVITIRAEDSPNVRIALAQQDRGLEPTGETLVPGVLSWDQYKQRRATWNPIEQCVGLDAEFYEGPELKMYPREWLDRAHLIAEQLKAKYWGGQRRVAKGIGVDPGEGGDDTAWAVVDDLGLLFLEAFKTPDTAIITGRTLGLMKEWNVDPSNVCFDRGGGGKEHADRLRMQGYNVRTVAFGETLVADPRRGMKQFPERLDEREEKYAYVNRRAQMFGDLRTLINPLATPAGWGIPRQYAELRRQLDPIPLLYSPEGRMEMLPKNKREGTEGKCLFDLIGCSPDEADAVVLAIHAMLHKPPRRTAGSMG